MKYLELIKLYEKQFEEKEALYFLITEVSNQNLSQLFLSLNEEINSIILVLLQEKIKLHLEKNIPVQYLVGHCYFFGLKLSVNKNVLIPRFDTETVVEESLRLIKENNYHKICDLGTGSGCIAIAIKKSIPTLEVIAIDNSPESLEVALKNANDNNVEIDFFKNDLLTDFSERFDCLISNPPYLDKDEQIMSLVKDHEPHSALYSPNKGLYHYEMILKQADNNLQPQGTIIFEIPSFRDFELEKLFNKYNYNVIIKKDNRGLSRIAILRKEENK